MTARQTGFDRVDAEVAVSDQRDERHVALREQLGGDVAAVDHRDHAGDDDAERRDPVERQRGRAAGADDVVDQQHAGAGLQPGALDPLLASALLLFLAHGEPGLAGDHRDAVRQRVGTHGEPADRVELDAVVGRELGDRAADDRQPLAGVDGVLAVDVVVAELTARQLERLVAAFVAAGADQLECGLPMLGARGQSLADPSALGQFDCGRT